MAGRRQVARPGRQGRLRCRVAPTTPVVLSLARGPRTRLWPPDVGLTGPIVGTRQVITRPVRTRPRVFPAADPWTFEPVS
ncbi:hypothetical protein KPB2_5521 [Klebsiella pneumoniae Kb677]|nr:hypothetical protein KPB2_5521 [Klebsiella pneumoniae Kb677]